MNTSSKVVFIGKPLFTKFNGNYWQFEKTELDAVLHFFYPRTINDLSNEFSLSEKVLAIKPKMNKISIGTFLRLRGGGYISSNYLPKVFFNLLKFRLVLLFPLLFLPKSFSLFIYNSLKNYVRS